MRPTGTDGSPRRPTGTTTLDDPAPIASCASAFTELSAGSFHTCARRADGSLWCWGSNEHGQLGDGTSSTRTTPVPVTTLGTRVAGAAAGTSHTCAIDESGALWCWGSNSAGQLGDGSNIDRPLPVPVTALGTTVVEVTAGGDHTCARRQDGTMWCWGDNPFGQLGDGTQTARATPVQVTALESDVAQITAGLHHACALLGDGSAWCWGRNLLGQVGDGSVWSPDDDASAADRLLPVPVAGLGAAAAVRAGVLHTCARKPEGTLWCWGRNEHGEVGDGTDGASRFQPAQVVALGAEVAEVAPGGSFTCARKTDGTTWCWGDNQIGQLGIGHSDTPVAGPVQVTALGATVRQLSLGGSHACALREDGTPWCWGNNGSGQVGSGLETSPATPTEVPSTCP